MTHRFSQQRSTTFREGSVDRERPRGGGWHGCEHADPRPCRFEACRSGGRSLQRPGTRRGHRVRRSRVANARQATGMQKRRSAHRNAFPCAHGRWLSQPNCPVCVLRGIGATPTWSFAPKSRGIRDWFVLEPSPTTRWRQAILWIAARPRPRGWRRPVLAIAVASIIPSGTRRPALSCSVKGDLAEVSKSHNGDSSVTPAVGCCPVPR